MQLLHVIPSNWKNNIKQNNNNNTSTIAENNFIWTSSLWDSKSNVQVVFVPIEQKLPHKNSLKKDPMT